MSSFRADESSSREEKNPTGIGVIVLFFFLFVALFFLLRINRPAFLILLGLILLGAGIYYVYQGRKAKQRAKARAGTTEGIIDQRLQDCHQQIQKNEAEIVDIRKNIHEIEDRIRQSKDLKQPTLQESDKLINAFKKELEMRASKIRFYENCREKLITLRDNHRMLEEINDKQQKLKLLQESHYEDLADMESLKSQLELDKSYINTIDTLSLRMLKSHSLASTQGLELELKEMTKELRRL